ncbi:NAD(P)H-dependent FMN reductase [Lipingzhangella halophila]|uniref:NAD(P)H-dependent FMN reductase n=1 Tax=Lipingzhangella halophila TaxID=1783352 RepID=A0A7W7RJX3_9ACTN|nr:NAD(P)H-dependent oxidoreductase [Lipingzhangella halophila]MBB4933290.1 NAD(P)H-dependent FMN reductase [Lipingzhangella halophila]
MADSRTLNVAVIIGSTRKDRFCPTPAKWISRHAEQRGDLNVDLVDLKEAALPDVLNGGDDDPVPAPVQALQPRLDRADAFIVVTPVYNKGYPASLKTAIDWYFQEWSAKPVGFVSYGGIGGGLYAVEQLRQVFNEVHATTIRNTISFANYWEHFDEHGETVEGQPLEAAAKGFLDQLGWWGRALREAREQTPYAA